jgi:hypothetical protein
MAFLPSSGGGAPSNGWILDMDLFERSQFDRVVNFLGCVLVQKLARVLIFRKNGEDWALDKRCTHQQRRWMRNSNSQAISADVTMPVTISV